MVTVKYTETYDLSTQVGSVGIIGIHTPRLFAIKKMYPGLFMNYKYYRVDGCDVTMACASMLPADPLQVGTEAGDIAPQDMFNPILYKAVSNESFNTLQARLYSTTDMHNYSSVGKDDTLFTDASIDTSYANEDEQFCLYYGLLAGDLGFRHAMPQQGLSMQGLYPIVYEMLSAYGNVGGMATNVNNLFARKKLNSAGVSVDTNTNYLFRGASKRMPRLPTTNSFVVTTNPTDGKVSNASDPMTIPETYVACIITPPAKLHRLYYRMRVTWYFTFEEVCPVEENGKPKDIADLGNITYASDYIEQSSKMTKTTNSVDTDGVDVDLIMTSGK